MVLDNDCMEVTAAIVSQLRNVLPSAPKEYVLSVCHYVCYNYVTCYVTVSVTRYVTLSHVMSLCLSHVDHNFCLYIDVLLGNWLQCNLNHPVGSSRQNSYLCSYKMLCNRLTWVIVEGMWLRMASLLISSLVHSVMKCHG